MSTLERDIFGGSDSELSSDEEERRRDSPGPGGDEDESSAAESGDEYVQQRAAPKPKKRSKARRGDDDEESGKRAQRKRKRRQPLDEEELNALPPEEAAKRRLDQQIEAILKPKRASRPKKRKNDEDVLDRFADEEVSRLREAMLNAAQEDEQANRERLPAMAKLRLLPSAMDILRKASLAQSIIDNNLLDGVRRWLEPLPDTSLPALNIQTEFFPVLKRMEFIDSAVLKESGLGRIVLFYTKCKRVTPAIARQANELVSTWSRPIIKRSASYRDRIIPVAQQDGTSATRAPGAKLNAIMLRARAEEKTRVRKNAVAIPTRNLENYTVAPNVNAGVMRNNHSIEMDVDRRRRNAERMRALTRKVNTKN